MTYKRQELLKKLCDSFFLLKTKPHNIIIVDNENSDITKMMCHELNVQLNQLNCTVHYLPLEQNTGGAGGFSRGVRMAYELGDDWFWLMDDDVLILEDAVDKVLPWLKCAVENSNRVLQVCRLNFDDTPFYWQYHFLEKLGIPNPIAPSGFLDGEEARKMNTACFEGGIFHRSVVEEIGLPDARFFIYWDDTMYGYLASKVTNPILINETCLKRTRSLEHIKIGKIRKLNSTSDMTRYYIMRNRGHIAQYLKANNQFNPLIFAIGTCATFSKEFIRLFITKSVKTGFPRLIRGLFDSRKIIKDKNWETYKQIEPLVQMHD